MTQKRVEEPVEPGSCARGNKPVGQIDGDAGSAEEKAAPSLDAKDITQPGMGTQQVGKEGRL